MAFLGCASSRTQEGTGEYIDDSLITTKVKAAILAEPGLNVSELNVETFKGVVQLSGFVSSREEINAAMRGGARRQWCQIGQERHATQVSSARRGALTSHQTH